MALIDEMTIEVDRDTDATTVKVSGEVDFGNVGRLRGALLDVIGESGNVMLDLGAVAFMDSTALGVVIQGKKRLDESGRQLVITALSPRARRVIEIAGLAEYLAR